jgi:hypothetical protein
MRRVKLEIESLTVESFGTCPAAVGRGTVMAHAAASADCSVVCTFDWDCTG